MAGPGLHRVGVYAGDVFDGREGRRLDHAAGGVLQCSHVLLSRAEAVAGCGEGAEDDWRGGALLGREIGVAAAHREAVRFPHGGDDDDPGGDVEVAHEPPHNGGLLSVLAAEVGAVRQRLQQEFRHDGRHAVEVAGPRGALQRKRGAVEVDGGGEAGWVHLFNGGSEDAVDALPLQEFEVGGERARVAFEVLAGAELRGVHKDRGNDGRALGACGAHEGEVAVVERAHRRDEADGAGGVTQR